MKGVSVYETVTNAIITELERGVAPWVKPWASGETIALPYNATSQRAYSGVNILLLWSEAVTKGYRSPAWLTFKQANALGGRIRKSEKAAHIVYAATFKKTETDLKTGEEVDQAIPFLKWYTVFNVEQTEGLPAHLYEVSKPKPFDQAIGQADALIEAIGADVRHGWTIACYYPSQDFIALPHPGDFESAGHYYATSLHEHTHWTAHSSRLNRDLTGRFGTEAYAAEELVAELGAAYLCAALGIPGELRHAEYIGHWLNILRNDKRAIFTAASAAQKASEYLLANGETEAREVREQGAFMVPDRFSTVTPVDLSDIEHASVVRLALASLAARHRPGSVLTSPKQVRDYLQLQLASRRNEVFGVVFLDNRHRVIRFEEMFQGTIDGTSVHARVVVQRSLEVNAAAVIFCHNHPSGVAEPSQADESITRRLKDALSLIDVRVLDHFVVSTEEVVSFSERGLL